MLLLIFASMTACSPSSSGSNGDGSQDTGAGGSSCDPIEAGASTMRIAAVGDSGTGDANQYAVADLIGLGDTEADFDVLTILGDMIYEDGDPDLIDERILTPYAGTLDGDTMLIPVLGNHDVRMGLGDTIMDELGAPGAWYSHREGGVLLIVLDSNRPNNATQLAWLEAELAAADDQWIVVAMHHPMYSSGSHGSSLDVRNAWKTLFETHGVDLVLAGHDHDYQRQEVINDITYIVSGGGAKLRDAGSASFTLVAEKVLHYVEIDVTDEVLEATAHGVSGTVDQFSICHVDSNLN